MFRLPGLQKIVIAHGLGPQPEYNYLASDSPRIIFWLPSSSLGYNYYIIDSFAIIMEGYIFHVIYIISYTITTLRIHMHIAQGGIIWAPLKGTQVFYMKSPQGG